MNALTPKEVTIIQMSLSALIEDMTSVSKDQSYPFTPESITKEISLSEN